MSDDTENPAWIDAAAAYGEALSSPDAYGDFPPLRLEGSAEPLPHHVHRGFVARAMGSYDRFRAPAPFEDFGPLERLDLGSMDAFTCALVDAWIQSQGDESLAWVEAFCRAFPSAAVVETIRASVKGVSWKSGGRIRLLEQLAIMAVPEGFYALRLLEQNGTGQDLAFRGSQAAKFARRFHGLSDEEFQDLCMPSLGLDDHGVRALDYGSRTIEMRVRDALEFAFVDLDSGKSYKSLPRAKKSDDADEVAAIRDALNPSLKIVRENTKRLWPRLQRDLASGRAWRVEHVVSRLLPNPIVASTLRGLIWHLGERDGEPVLARLDEGSAFVDLALDEVSLDGIETIRLARVSDFGARLGDWLRHMEDFEVVQPIEQLADATFVLDGPVVAQMMRDFEAGEFVLDIKAIQRAGKEGGVTLDPQRGQGTQTNGLIGVRGTSRAHELVAVTNPFQGAITGWDSSPIRVTAIGYRGYVETWYQREDPGEPLTLEQLASLPGDDVIAFFKVIASLRLTPKG